MGRSLKNLYHKVEAIYWAIITGFPAKKLLVIGVTGTDGKTTTCTLIYEMLKAQGLAAGMITTVAVKWVNKNGIEEEEGKGLHSTNPEPKILQPLLQKMQKRGVKIVILETTSHGIDQYRTWGCNYQMGILTNISHEHLDYHKTFEAYRKTKLKMFLEASMKTVILNQDDPSYENFKQKIADKNPNINTITYGKSSLKEISPALAGDYNKYNIEAAMRAAKMAGADEAVCREVVKTFAGVPGRREEVRAGQKFRVVVDFAHTPNALEALLTQLRKELPKGKKLTVVFGCTGERDRDKRPIMGEIAARLAERVVVTSDDTRSEKQGDIYEQIVAGIKNRDQLIATGKLIRADERKKAVEIAIKSAQSGDIVALAGKGHEKTILIGKNELPWSDSEAARQAILQ